jgi:hypothetical protein
MRSTSNFLALRSWEGSWKKVDQGCICVITWKNCDNMLLFLQTLYLTFSSTCYVFMFLPLVEKIIKKYRYGCSDAHTSIDYRRCETTRKEQEDHKLVLESSRRSNLTRQAM